jgi:probable phosphoglycerate mutase
MTKLILTRHGHVEGIDPVRFRGRTDLPLTARGLAEAQATAERIARTWRPSAVYTSPMSRCIATGRAITSACAMDSPSVLSSLNDLDYGFWQWMTHDEVRQRWPIPFDTWQATPHLVRFPNGESLQDLVARTADAIRSVLERHPSETDTVVLVGHDSVNRALLLQVLDQPLSAYWRIQQTPCSLSEIDIDRGRIDVRRINETAHLESIV